MTWITDNKGQGPWNLTKDQAWDDNKGQGAWDFTEQPDIWGYLNNPRWQTSPSTPINYTKHKDDEPQIWNIDGNYSSGDSKQHMPCGHWHKKKVGWDGWDGWVRITQEAIEVLRHGMPVVRITQEAIEVLKSIIPAARITQEVIEILKAHPPLSDTWCWGHDTGVTENNIANLIEGAGTAQIMGIGDHEGVCLNSGEHWILPAKNIGGGDIEITFDKYKTGIGSGNIEYRTGSSKSECEAASWKSYVTPFEPIGWVQIKVSVH